MKTNFRYFLLASTLTFLVSAPAFAQTYDSNSGGYRTGYGTVYGTFGLAQATQNMYNTMQMNMQRAMARSAMIKRFGRAAVEKAERETSASRGRQTAPSAMKVPPPVVAKNFGKFRPDATVDTGRLISDTLGETPEEKALLKQIYTTVKAGYDKEAAAKGWSNNIAGAFTFFLVSNSTIYHDSSEPGDETVEAIYAAVNQTLDEIPEFGKMANKDKQAFNNIMIAFAAIPLATYTQGKEAGDAATVGMARQLAGQLIELVMKTSPDNLKFGGDSKTGN
jgi:hypothetical protein